MALRRVSLRIKGRVQGVFYRESTRQTATALGVAGWVKNLPDGDVAAMAQGPGEAVEALIAWCRKGPPAAQVVEVIVQDEAPGSDVSSFAVVR